jgi:TonB family protein
MTMSQLSQTGYVSVTHEARAQERRKLGPMAYVELGQDNGGILLNLGEGGFAVQSALAFQVTEFAELRFQVPQFRGWLSARGRIVWMSENKTVAGIQFLELPETARREIRKWVSGKDKGEPAPDERQGLERGTTISATEYRGDPRIQALRATEQEPPAPRLGRRPGSAEVREVGGTIPNGLQEAGAKATTGEAPVHDFRFSEYSMFAAEASPAEIWIDAGQQKRGWRQVVLLSILMAALFFVLGATVGRGTVDHWIAYVEAWMQGPAVPSVKPPAPVDESSGTVPDQQEGGSQGAGANGDPTADVHQTPNEGPGSNPEAAGSVLAGTLRENGEAGKSDAPVEGVPGKNSPLAAMPAPKQPVKTGSTRSIIYGDGEGAQTGARTGEHSILVNAPEPGNPPFVVNLPSDAISASSTVAISARRSMQVPPRAGLGGSSERVVIGRLISHGEPFYPAEARNRRLEGGVEVHATIGRTGQVISVRPVSGPPLLASAAMTAIREWRYEPTFIDGDPVETQAEITMVFRLR